MNTKIKRNNIDEVLIELIEKSLEDAKKSNYNELVLILNNSLKLARKSNPSVIITDLTMSLMLYLSNNPNHSSDNLGHLLELLGKYNSIKNGYKFSPLKLI